MKPEDYDYVIANNICLFQKGPLSQWWGGFKGQNGGIVVDSIYDMYFLFLPIGVCDGFDNLQSIKHLETIDRRLNFNCCEQWMMACKAILFNDVDMFGKIMAEKSPSKQKDLGRQISNYKQEIWDEFKYDIVLRGNTHKFEQNQELNEFLKSFNPFIIFAEAAPWDKVWGIGLGPDDPKALDIHTWEGENLLGKVISNIRQLIEDDDYEI